MIDLSPVLATVILLGGILVFVLLGYPIAFAIGGLGVLMGFLLFGPPVFSLMYDRVFSVVFNFVYLAVPLFIFMGIMLETTGVADRMYEALYVSLGGLRGGLAIVTIVLGTILAACVGIVGASVTMLTLVALPSMLKRGYSKSLAAGSVCAAGTIGTLIPPSLIMIIYGPIAQVSVGRLFMGAIVPGLLLSTLYCVYIGIRCLLQPEAGPAIAIEERTVPFIKKTRMVVVSVFPTALIVLAVLGTIFFGIAPPTEAAAVGATAAILLSIAYRRFSFQSLREAVLRTFRVSSMILLVAALAVAYMGVFLLAGGGGVVQDLILRAPGGRWGVFVAIQAAIFVLGFFLTIEGIIFIVIPIVAPMLPLLGFDPVWFGTITMINLQAAYMSPPVAPAVFYFRGAVSKESGMTMGDVFRGIVPFLMLVITTMVLCVAFPKLVLWLPGQMLG